MAKLDGKVVSKPKVLPIVFPGETLVPQITDFYEKLASSSYWVTTVAEYGVGPLVVLPTATLKDVPPKETSDLEIKALLQRALTTGTELGVPDPDTLYALFFPASTTIALDGQKSCADYGGYHSETSVNGIPVGYAVVPRCDYGRKLAIIDILTATMSHETVEWATNPFPFTSTAYGAMEKDFRVWEWAFGPELTDLCFYVDPNRYTTPADLGYLVDRSWSNVAAAGGHNPCVPRVGGAYFVGVPMVRDDVTFEGTVTKGVAVTIGQTTTLPIQFYSEDPNAAPWNLQVLDHTAYMGGIANSEIHYELAHDQGRYGSATSLTIRATAPSSAILLVVATRGNEVHLWPVLVVARK